MLTFVLPRTFLLKLCFFSHLKITEKESGSEKVFLINHDSPEFLINNLSPGNDYLIRVTASNSQGDAQTVTLPYFVPIDIAEKRLSLTTKEETPEQSDLVNMAGILPTLLGIFMGAVGSLIILSLVIFLLRKRRIVMENGHLVTLCKTVGGEREGFNGTLATSTGSSEDNFSESLKGSASKEAHHKFAESLKGSTSTEVHHKPDDFAELPKGSALKEAHHKPDIIPAPRESFLTRWFCFKIPSVFFGKRSTPNYTRLVNY